MAKILSLTAHIIFMTHHIYEAAYLIRQSVMRSILIVYAPVAYSLTPAITVLQSVSRSLLRFMAETILSYRISTVIEKDLHRPTLSQK